MSSLHPLGGLAGDVSRWKAVLLGESGEAAGEDGQERTLRWPWRRGRRFRRSCSLWRPSKCR